MKERIKLFRKRVGMTQQDLADALGVGQSQISNIENGRRAVSMELARRLNALFPDDFPLWAVFGKTEPADAGVHQNPTTAAGLPTGGAAIQNSEVEQERAA